MSNHPAIRIDLDITASSRILPNLIIVGYAPYDPFERTMEEELNSFEQVYLEMSGPHEVSKGMYSDVLEFQVQQKRKASSAAIINPSPETSPTPPAEFDVPPIYEAVKLAVQLTSQMAQEIEKNKIALDILTDFATIIGVTLPIVTSVHYVLRNNRKAHESKKISSVTITIGDISVTTTDQDLKGAGNEAVNIARKLLREHPQARPSSKVKISGKLVDPLAQAAVNNKQKSQPEHRRHKKRKKPY